ncbi:hypothetical protein ARUE_c40210 [Arthrobacter sp. Rue61a]|nr:hypothetical protein ARUE_c40210 [Arthrobacter sp. Rue61a]
MAKLNARPSAVPGCGRRQLRIGAAGSWAPRTPSVITSPVWHASHSRGNYHNNCFTFCFEASGFAPAARLLCAGCAMFTTPAALLRCQRDGWGR